VSGTFWLESANQNENAMAVKMLIPIDTYTPS
jgi:hypothetical protein